MHLILYSKPGCHLCEGLHEKLAQIQSLDLDLDVRDITTRDDWFQAYQYEIPVLVLERRQKAEAAGESREVGEAIQNSKLDTPQSGSKLQNSKLETLSLIPLPRPSPRASVQQLEQMLRKYL
ncbi:thioredoxin family protein [Stenomitos frigidus ULC18]|uniref:Thioredoxin family protein n=1 Tax=Stenomitos frigidus ULC18 TaxID=2107698 RepID=A0A2T1DY01_9CYAN|nr:glutaredoxin family protein [Stenomitos frigidus]PSB25383.1 thioredoxin family protein [Stenomitos frigidus ULC18]